MGSYFVDLSIKNKIPSNLISKVVKIANFGILLLTNINICDTIKYKDKTPCTLKGDDMVEEAQDTVL